MSALFHIALYQPLFNALIVLYKTVAFKDLGLAIILLTLVIRVILYPLFYKSYRNQTLLQKIQPHIKKIQLDHKDNKEKQAQELMALYKEHKVNPFSGFFLILIQLPILIALYRVFLSGLSGNWAENLYGFVAAPEAVNGRFLGLITLQEPNIIIIALSAIAQYIQAKLSMPKSVGGEVSSAEKIGKQMSVVGPLLTLLILYSLPAAVGLYWFTTSAFSVIQQIAVNKSLKREIPDHGPVSGTSQKNA